MSEEEKPKGGESDGHEEKGQGQGLLKRGFLPNTRDVAVGLTGSTANSKSKKGRGP